MKKPVKTLKELVAEYIRAHPGSTVLDLTRHFTGNRKSMCCTITRLLNDYTIKPGDKRNGRLVMYYIDDTDRPDEPAIAPKQSVKKAWPALDIKQQTPWSALGL